ncbi:hypothetical protein [Vibrio campbellii]|uniref:hypothetical protein n=1 Tax=Vibrio campbellii TaxID=680 RepID=UPI0005ED4E4F|nr:hypothetical protein [Vibrio campbellii]
MYNYNHVSNHQKRLANEVLTYLSDNPTLKDKINNSNDLMRLVPASPLWVHEYCGKPIDPFVASMVITRLADIAGRERMRAERAEERRLKELARAKAAKMQMIYLTSL